MGFPRHILLTGASGYIGTRLFSLAQGRDFAITVLSRSRPPQAHGAGVRWFHWSLMEPVPIAAFEPSNGFGPVDAVIHAAHKWDSDLPEEKNENVVGSRALLIATREAGVKRFIFCSSVSSREGALNRYGRVKWAIARELKGPNGIEARIGLVYGGPRRGQWGTLCDIVQSFPVLPLVATGRRVQPIHLDDVCEALLRLAETDKVERTTYGLADPCPVAFGLFVKMVARKVLDRSIVIIPVPIFFTRLAFAALSPVSRFANMQRERVLGLAGLPTIVCAEDLSELGLSLRPLDEGLSNEVVRPRRRLLLEGYILLHYLIDAKPGIGLLRRYVRGVEKFTNKEPLFLPALAKWFPATLAFYEPASQGNGSSDDLRGRLQIALYVADACSHSGISAYDYVGNGIPKVLFRFLLTGLAEAIFMPIRLLLRKRGW